MNRQTSVSLVVNGYDGKDHWPHEDRSGCTVAMTLGTDNP
jgi:hypothetical protein